MLKYEKKEYLDILVELIKITRSHSELVSTIGLCNFDSDHTREACEYLLSKTGAVGIVSNQIQVHVSPADAERRDIETPSSSSSWTLGHSRGCAMFAINMA